jgi:hypothetical protein
MCSDIDNRRQAVARISYGLVIPEPREPVQINWKQFCLVTVFIKIAIIGRNSRIVTRFNAG